MVNFSSKKRTAVQSTLRDPRIARSCAPPRRDSQGDLEGAFWVDKPKPNTLHIDRISFRDSISLTYSIADQRLKAERQTLRWPQVAMRMHFRVGSDQPTLENKL